MDIICYGLLTKFLLTGGYAFGSGPAGVSLLVGETVYMPTNNVYSDGLQSTSQLGPSGEVTEPQAAIMSSWASTTYGSQQGLLQFVAYDTTGREGFRVTSNGSAAKIGFFGTAGTAQPTVTGSKSSNAALTSVIAALASLGLVVDNSS